MARENAMARITKRTVDALVAHDRERVVWDDDIKGFAYGFIPPGVRPISSRPGTGDG